MATRKFITAEDGTKTLFQEGESFDVLVTFNDLNGNPIVKLNLLSLKCALFDTETSVSINGRAPYQNVLDANGGTVATDGTLTFRLQPNDNVILGSIDVGSVETHSLEFEWSFFDGVLTRIGRSGPLLFSLEKLPVVT